MKGGAGVDHQDEEKDREINDYLIDFVNFDKAICSGTEGNGMPDRDAWY